jgi:hypothetical protein
VADASILPFYSFDTSAIINGRRDIFMPSTFAPIWTAIEEMVSLGQVLAVDEVRRELKKRSDDAYAWARRCRGLFVPLDRDVQLAAREVLKAHPRLMGTGGGPRNSADPFVVGLALARGGTVVMQETPRNLTKPRMPDVCDVIGVPCVTLPTFVNDQGWQFLLGGGPQE